MEIIGLALLLLLYKYLDTPARMEPVVTAYAEEPQQAQPKERVVTSA